MRDDALRFQSPIVTGAKGRVWTSGPTIGSIIRHHNGVGPGFDLLRLSLAALIFYGHAKWISGSSVGVDVVFHNLMQQGMTDEQARLASFDWGFLPSCKRAFHLALVPMFFALSGFLVTGSAFRTRAVVPFLGLRALRIVPALAVEIVLSALVLGAALTTLPLRSYYSSPDFFAYFSNIFGFVHMTLPGVFENSPATGIVNVNLWTLPSEFHCYLLTALLIASGMIFNKKLFTVLFAVCSAALFAASISTGFGVSFAQIYLPPVVVYYFFVGCFFYHWQDSLPASKWLLLPMSLLGLWGLAHPNAVFLAPLLVTYVTIMIGCCNFPRIPVLQSGDYSYGIYLYGFPICQAVVLAMPQLHGHTNLTVAVSGIVTFAFAAVSWRLVERRALTLKRYLTPKTIPQTPVQRLSA